MAGKVRRVQVKIEGLNELKRKLKAEALLAEPLADAMKALEQMLRTAWLGVMPTASGAARSKIVTKVSTRPIPTWVRIKTTATRSSRKYKRYRYPRRQEYDPKSRNKGKLTRATDGVQAKAPGVLDAAGRAIEAKWRG